MHGHVERKDDADYVKACTRLVLEGKSPEGKPRKIKRNGGPLGQNKGKPSALGTPPQNKEEERRNINMNLFCIKVNIPNKPSDMCEVESLPVIGIFSVSVSSVIVSSSSTSTHLHMARGIYKIISQILAAKPMITGTSKQ